MLVFVRFSRQSENARISDWLADWRARPGPAIKLIESSMFHHCCITDLRPTAYISFRYWLLAFIALLFHILICLFSKSWNRYNTRHPDTKQNYNFTRISVRYGYKSRADSIKSNIACLQTLRAFWLFLFRFRSEFVVIPLIWYIFNTTRWGYTNINFSWCSLSVLNCIAFELQIELCELPICVSIRRQWEEARSHELNSTKYNSNKIIRNNIWMKIRHIANRRPVSSTKNNSEIVCFSRLLCLHWRVSKQWAPHAPMDVRVRTQGIVRQSVTCSCSRVKMFHQINCHRF